VSDLTRVHDLGPWETLATYQTDYPPTLFRGFLKYAFLTAASAKKTIQDAQSPTERYRLIGNFYMLVYMILNTSASTGFGNMLYTLEDLWVPVMEDAHRLVMQGKIPPVEEWRPYISSGSLASSGWRCDPRAAIEPSQFLQKDLFAQCPLIPTVYPWLARMIKQFQKAVLTTLTAS